MKTLDDSKIHSTAIITDIRNFTKTFKDFQGNSSMVFLEFLEVYYSNQQELAKILSDDIHMSSTGDGILTIFKDKLHHRNGYAYVILSHKLLTNLCDSFMKDNPNTDISFGMGVDSGHIWSLGDGLLKTYVGTVINRASRIEGITKQFANTTTAIGNSLYKYLIKDFYPSTYREMENYSSYDLLLSENPNTVLISKQFMLQYVFDMPLKGVQQDAPIFRISSSLFDDEKLFDCVLNKLISQDKIDKIKKII